MCMGTSGLPLGRAPEGAGSVSRGSKAKEDVGYKKGCPKRNKVKMGRGNQKGIKQNRGK